MCGAGVSAARAADRQLTWLFHFLYRDDVATVEIDIPRDGIYVEPDQGC